MRVILLAVVLGVVGTARACPVCDTGTGQEVRSGIFDGDFGRNLVGILLPFPIMAGVVMAIHFGGWKRRG